MPEIPKIPTVNPVLPLKAKEGWGQVVSAGTLSASKKWHYFRDGRSLCGRWVRFSNNGLEQGMDNSPDNCAECRRRLLKEQENMRAR